MRYLMDQLYFTFPADASEKQKLPHYISCIVCWILNFMLRTSSGFHGAKAHRPMYDDPRSIDESNALNWDFDELTNLLQQALTY